MSEPERPDEQHRLDQLAEENYEALIAEKRTVHENVAGHYYLHVLSGDFDKALECTMEVGLSVRSALPDNALSSIRLDNDSDRAMMGHLFLELEEAIVPFDLLYAGLSDRDLPHCLCHRYDARGTLRTHAWAPRSAVYTPSQVLALFDDAASLESFDRLRERIADVVRACTPLPWFDQHRHSRLARGMRLIKAPSGRSIESR